MAALSGQKYGKDYGSLKRHRLFARFSLKEQAPLWHSQCQKGACSLLYGLIFQSAVVAAEGKIVLHLPTQYKLCVFQRPVVQQPIQLCPLCRGVAVFILQDLIFGVRSLEPMPSSRCRMKWFFICPGVNARFLHGFKTCKGCKCVQTLPEKQKSHEIFRFHGIFWCE